MIKRIRQFLKRSPIERALFIRAIILLGAQWAGLRLFPRHTLRVGLSGGKGGRFVRVKPSVLSPDRMAWAVVTADRYFPGTQSCLIQALTLQRMLEREGYPARLHIGVARSPDSLFQAHAWVESQGRVLIGEKDLSAYTLLPSLEELSA